MIKEERRIQFQFFRLYIFFGWKEPIQFICFSVDIDVYSAIIYSLVMNHRERDMRLCRLFQNPLSLSRCPVQASALLVLPKIDLEALPCYSSTTSVHPSSIRGSVGWQYAYNIEPLYPYTSVHKKKPQTSPGSASVSSKLSTRMTGVPHIPDLI
jgi:hypothetical protein